MPKAFNSGHTQYTGLMDSKHLSQSRELNQPTLERIAAGDQTAVADCIDRYGNLVWSLAKQHFRNAADAEDATQDVFIELWQKAGSFDRTQASETTFVTMVARRRLIDRLRRQRSSLKAVANDEAHAELPDMEKINPVELADEAQKAAECMHKLGEAQQRVIVMSVHQSVPHSAIASRLNMPLGTVKSYARRALLQLRDCMSRSMPAGHLVGATDE